MLQSDTYSWLKSHDLLDSYTSIYEPETVELKIPKTISSKKYYKIFDDNRIKKSNKVFLAKLKNATVSCSNAGVGGACVQAEDNTFLQDIINYWGDSKDNSCDLHYLPGTSILAAEKWGGSNLCHWLLTALPKLGVIRMMGLEADRIVINSLECKFVQESMSILGIDPRKIVELSKNPKVKAENLILSSPIGHGVNADKNTCRILRTLFKDQIKSGKRRIYVARGGKRKILNESEVLSILLPYGFEVIRSESLSFKDQIETFSQSEIVVAPHGAGLTNIVFCNPHTKVLEILPPTYIGHCYWILGDSNNLDLYYLVGEGPELYENYYYWSDGTANITVNIKELKEILKIMEI